MCEVIEWCATKKGAHHQERHFENSRVLQASKDRLPHTTMLLAVDVAATQCPDHFTWQSHEIQLGAVLGSGRFATVRAVSSLQGLPPLAAKVVEDRRASHEVALLTTFDHPHILKCFGLVQLPRHELILVERCACELFDRVESMDSLDQQQAAQWMLELISAVEHTHAHGVVHRDIKPENILLRTMDAAAPLVLGDFGSAKRVAGVLHSPCGSRGYAAPETVTACAAASQGYGTAADMWSCGVVAHVLLTGTLPTRAVHAASASEAWPNNLRQAFEEEKALTYVSSDAVDFLCALLRPHGRRLSASAALAHRWLTAQADVTSTGAPPTTRTPSPPPAASPLLLTPKRLRETRLAARDDFRTGFRESASSGWSHADRRTSHRLSKGAEELQGHGHGLLASGHLVSVAEIPQAELPPPAFMRTIGSSARSLSAASGLDLLGHGPSPRKRASDEWLPPISQTPSTDVTTPPADDAASAAAAASASTTPEPQLKRARSISSCLMDLQFQ